MSIAHAESTVDVTPSYDTCAVLSLFCALIGLGLPALIFGCISISAHDKGSTDRGDKMGVWGAVLGFIELIATAVAVGFAMFG